MIPRTTIIAVLLLIYTTLLAQESENTVPARPLNNISTGMLGNASLASLHYTRLIPLNDLFLISASVGIGFNQEFQICVFGPCDSKPVDYFILPHSLTANVGTDRHFLEFGLGGARVNGAPHPYLFYGIIGYRLWPLKPGIPDIRLFGQLPLSGLNSVDFIYLPLGLTFGISF